VDTYLGSYATLGLLLAAGVLFLAAAYGANRLLRPARPGGRAERTVPYECGLDPVGIYWAQVQIRYYVYAYLFVIFAVEAVFLFPWAVVYAEPGFGLATAVEMGIFLAVLALGILYAWRRGVLRWT